VQTFERKGALKNKIKRDSTKVEWRLYDYHQPTFTLGFLDSNALEFILGHISLTMGEMAQVEPQTQLERTMWQNYGQSKESCARCQRGLAALRRVWKGHLIYCDLL